MKINLLPKPWQPYRIYRAIKEGKRLYLVYKFHGKNRGIHFVWGSSRKQAQSKNTGRRVLGI